MAAAVLEVVKIFLGVDTISSRPTHVSFLFRTNGKKVLLIKKIFCFTLLLLLFERQSGREEK